MLKGTPEIDALSVGEITVNFITDPLRVEGKAAFLNSQTKSTHGWTRNTTWSSETMRKLDELKQCMERDLGEIHFTSSEIPQKNAKVADNFFKPEGGIGEHLGTADDTKQI